MQHESKCCHFDVSLFAWVILFSDIKISTMKNFPHMFNEISLTFKLLQPAQINFHITMIVTEGLSFQLQCSTAHPRKQYFTFLSIVSSHTVILIREYIIEMF